MEAKHSRCVHASGRTTLLAALISLLLLMISANAHAQNQYIGGTVDLNGDQNAQAATLSGRYGIRLMATKVPGLELYGEVRGAFGITEGTTNIHGIDVDVKIERLAGAYVSMRNRMGGTNFTAYISLGLTRVDFKGSAADEVRADDSDLSFGGGLDWKLNDRWTLNVDGMRYVQNAYGDMVGVSIGVSRWFK